MPEIEYVTLANHAEMINNLLYLQGAGWTELSHPMGPQGQPGIVHFGVGVSVLVGWNETNRKYPLSLAIRHEDGQELLKIGAITEAGRPAGAQVGADLRSVLALNAEMQFPRPGGYGLHVELDGKTKSTSFRVNFPAPAGGPTSFSIPPLPPAF
jgi:hypothetical protein